MVYTTIVKATGKVNLADAIVSVYLPLASGLFLVSLSGTGREDK